jgi:glycerol-3-phosphate acyltransferase PlsY
VYVAWALWWGGICVVCQAAMMRHAEPLRFQYEGGKSKSLQFGGICVRGASEEKRAGAVCLLICTRYVMLVRLTMAQCRVLLGLVVVGEEQVQYPIPIGSRKGFGGQLVLHHTHPRSLSPT